MGRPRAVRLLATIVICLLTIKFPSSDGRKCVCTTKACLEAGADTCRTRFSCYTELILVDEGQGNTTTRGCTESATPLSCEIRPRSKAVEKNNDASSSLGHLRVRWPRLRCCDSHDYCNGVIPDPLQDRGKPATSTLSLEQQQHDTVVNLTETVEEPSDPPDRYHDKKSLDISSLSKNLCSNGLNSLTTQQQVKPLHIAALVLTVAALISVFAACYVISSFLRSHPNSMTAPASIDTTCKCRSEQQQFPVQNQDFTGTSVINDLAIKSLQRSPQTIVSA